MGAAFGDPPFNGAENDGGLDISLRSAAATDLGQRWTIIGEHAWRRVYIQLPAYAGAPFAADPG